MQALFVFTPQLPALGLTLYNRRALYPRCRSTCHGNAMRPRFFVDFFRY